MPIPQLKVIALGPLAIGNDNAKSNVRLTSTAQLLLIYLLTTGEPQLREELAELFWPERSAKQSASNLRTVLTELRKVCAPYLVITRTTIAVDATHVHYDVTAFQQALAKANEGQKRQDLAAATAYWETAVRLHQRPFLTAFQARMGPDVQLWLIQERELLYNQMLGAVRQLVKYYSDLQNFEALLPLAQRWFLPGGAAVGGDSQRNKSVFINEVFTPVGHG
ncbi:MAG: BTAD domain-containing putative transcriptional regulator [Caldilineaceae bacterium]